MSLRKNGRSLLVIDDDALFCDIIIDAFRSEDIEVHTAHNKKDGLKICSDRKIDVVLLDQKLPDGEGHLLCPDILKCNDETRIIFITAYPSFDSAVQAIKAGAHDYLSKPFELEELKLALRRSLEVLELERVKQVATYRSSKDRHDHRLVGNFGDGADTLSLIRLAASAQSPVLITGETGAGKNVVAAAIHYGREGGETPFISTNCAALPETLIEDELFGHEKGAFTDARAVRKGLFEIAEGGTLFLDEIGDMPLHLQSKLLGVLDEGRIRRLGGQSFIPVNVRIIAATNADPETLMSGANFRRDLYYRLSVIRIHLAPLRDRPEDIPALCRSFISQMARGAAPQLSEEEMDRLTRYSWPGNVRELRNIIERSLLLHDGGEFLHPSRLIEAPRPPVTPPIEGPVAPAAPPTLEEVEKAHIRRVLAAQDFNFTRSARVLGISLSTLKRKVREYRLTRPPVQSEPGSSK